MFFQTLRESPGDVSLPGSQLLVRGGFVRVLAPGAYAWLPLGAAVRERVVAALSGSMRELGAQPLHLPTLQPLDSADGTQPAWTNPPATVAPLSPPHYAGWMVADSHARLVMELARQMVQSYRQLPALLYHAWSPLQSELHPTRGLLDGRETQVFDLWDLERVEPDRAERAQHVLDEMVHLAETADLPTRCVAANLWDEGASRTQRLIWPVSSGDCEFVFCDRCGWAYERATAPTLKPPPPPEAPLERVEVATPDCRTIADLSTFLGVPPARTAKALFLIASGGAAINGRPVVAVVRGDTELSEVKLGWRLGVTALRPATEAEIRAIGAEPGYGSPIGLRDVEVVADRLVAASPNLVAGANRAGYHLLNTNCGRDYQPDVVADIAQAQAGGRCPACEGSVEVGQGVELAQLTSLDVVGHELPAATYLDASGQSQPLAVGIYRFFVDRFIAAVCEVHHDDSGLMWPRSLSPYDVLLMTAGKHNPEVNAVADRLEAELAAAGARVLYDDRDERAGVKFNDADLVGVPLRIVVGERGVAAGVVEVKHRRTGEVVAVPIAGLPAYVNALL
jgi:prolyl-tRNA synthetase